MFTTIYIHPERNLKLLTQLRNLVYVFTLDQNTRGTRTIREAISPETITRIKQDTGFFMSSIKDEYAKGQEVLYLLVIPKKILLSISKKIGRTLLITLIYWNVRD
jgi:hypothetical protein